jgi:hypothetical protein
LKVLKNPFSIYQILMDEKRIPLSPFLNPLSKNELKKRGTQTQVPQSPLFYGKAGSTLPTLCFWLLFVAMAAGIRQEALPLSAGLLLAFFPLVREEVPALTRGSPF